MTKHTPGPWLQDDEACIPSGVPYSKMLPKYEGFEVKNEDGWPVAFLPLFFAEAPTKKWPKKNELDWDEGYANLRLISAAPEMLEALQGFVENQMTVGQRYTNEGQAMLDAIAKALGHNV